LPLALHDAAAAALGGSVYLFGGANQAPSDAVIKVGSGSSRKTVARLPAAVSDVAAATVGNTAYVVGGYDGAAAVSTITAWRPGRVPKTVGHLPSPARYVAVAPLNGKLVIVGGTVGGSASRSILLFDPATGKLARAGRLSNAVTHAAAAAIGSTVYVIGGRGSALNAQTARVTAITVDAAGAAHSVRAGRIPRALSDLQAVRLGGEIVVTGGLDSQNAAQSDVLALHPSGRP
jgi:N-acetylneuraminic acid mutarotase